VKCNIHELLIRGIEQGVGMRFDPFLLAGQKIWQLRIYELIDVLRVQLRSLLS
jgi:hypothetical protein